MLYRVHLATSGIRTHTVVTDTDCTGEDRAFLKCVLRLVIVEYVLLHSWIIYNRAWICASVSGFEIVTSYHFLYFFFLLKKSTICWGIHVQLTTMTALWIIATIGFRVMVFNATFNNIPVISWRSVYWWRKPEYQEKITDLSKVTYKLYLPICEEYSFI